MAKQAITSPIGTVRFSNLNKPNTKFNKEGVYDVELVITENEFNHWNENTIKPILEKFRASDKKLVKAPIQTLVPTPKFDKNEDTGEYDVETDKVIIKFKIAASGVNSEGEPWSRGPVAKIDSKKNRLPDNFFLSMGDKIRVGFEPNPYLDPMTKTVKMSLNKLRGVQVIEHNEGDGQSSLFDEVDGGYSVGESSEEFEPEDNEDIDY